MEFDIDNIWATVKSATSEEIAALSRVVSITTSYYTRKKGQKHPEKKSRVIKYFNRNRIPSGLLPRIKEQLEEGVSIRFKDYRTVPNCMPIHKAYHLKLPNLPVKEADYSFQEDAVLVAIKTGRGLLHYPTGAGKTIIIAKIIASLNLRSIIIVPNLLLLNQTYDSFCRYFGEDRVGKLGEGEKKVGADIIVATQQTLYSIMKNDKGYFDAHIKNSFDVLFIDECHHVATGSGWVKDEQGRWAQKENPTNTWYNVAMEIDAYYRFGMSATLNTEGNSNNQFVLECVTGQIIASITVSELIDRQVLCPVDVTIIEIFQERYKVWKDIYEKREEEKVLVERGAYENNIIKNDQRNQKIADLANKLYFEGKKVLVQVDLVQTHGKILYELISNSIFLSGKSNKRERAEGIEEAKTNGSVLIGTIFKEGFDLPAINALIIAGGGKSEKVLIQKIGRVLRVAPGKERAEVFDFYDDDGGSMCERHSQKRLKVYQSEERYTVKKVGIKE